MAKRYIRINWKNSPSTSTPVNEPNLNQMDKGIKDCDDAIGDLALLKTTAKADLVAAINEQNENFTSAGTALKYRKLEDYTPYDPNGNLNLMTIIHAYFNDVITPGDTIIASISYYGGTATAIIRKDGANQGEYFVFGFNAGVFKRAKVGGNWLATQTIL